MTRRLRFLAACLLVPLALLGVFLLWPEPLPDIADLPPALAALGTRAVHGDPAAQGELGKRYFEGDGVPYNVVKAHGWLQAAARHGDAKAQLELGQMDLRGFGVLGRDPAFLPWLNAHLPFGHIPDARERSCATGMRWLRTAAEHGYAPAQESLARMYYQQGLFAPQYVAEGKKWLAKTIESYRQAAAHGSAEAERRLSMFYGSESPGYDLAEHLKWLRLAAEHGDKEAQYTLAGYCAQGWNVPKDEAAAFVWYRRAVEQGHIEARGHWGLLLAKGHGEPKDYAEAVPLLRQAADQGDALARIAMAFMCLRGNGVPQDEIEAWKWWRVVSKMWVIFYDVGDVATKLASDDERAEMAALEARLTAEQKAEAQRRADEYLTSHPR
ncbi:MAG: sel1 repeat family protein [Chthoniobacter sp.]|nr:sel1 repeat family protein [Chthoniobacter sp.]